MAIQHINQVELSRRWRLSPRTLEGWRRQGTGPQFLKIGGRVVYRLEDVEAYEALHLRRTPEAALRPQVRLTAVPPTQDMRRLRRVRACGA